MTEYYAHSLEGKPPSEWQRLDEHLNNVAVMARSFAEKFDCGALSFWLGLLHDIGKINLCFQSHIKAMEEN